MVPEAFFSRDFGVFRHRGANARGADLVTLDAPKVHGTSHRKSVGMQTLGCLAPEVRNQLEFVGVWFSFSTVISDFSGILGTNAWRGKPLSQIHQNAEPSKSNLLRPKVSRLTYWLLRRVGG